MSTRTLLSLIVAISTAASCTQRVRDAPFRARPDSVDPGSLLGPFNGRVLDATSGDPVAGAIVYATWSFQAGYGLTTPAGYHEAIASTDAGGRYTISELGSFPKGSSARIADFVLVIYKRGYVGYRSDRRWTDLGPRRDFAQEQNEVALERWRADFSHVRHLRYLGGGGPIATLTSWEVPEAAAELSGSRGIDGPRLTTDFTPMMRRLVAAQILSEREIKAITGTETTFETGPLGDEPDSESYSSQHFSAVGQAQTFDIAVRMWTESPEDAVKRYQELADTLDRIDSRDEIGDQSFRAEEQDIFGIAFVDKRRGILVLLTCGVSQCETMESAVALARKAHATLEAIDPIAGDGK